VKVIILNNVGFAKANNLGFKKINRSSKYLLLLNPDTFLDVDFVRKAISIMNRATYVGLLSGPFSVFTSVVIEVQGRLIVQAFLETSMEGGMIEGIMK
jgi:hypothetical protein